MILDQCEATTERGFPRAMDRYAEDVVRDLRGAEIASHHGRGRNSGIAVSGQTGYLYGAGRQDRARRAVSERAATLAAAGVS